MIKYEISLVGRIWSVVALGAADSLPSTVPDGAVYILPHIMSDCVVLTTASRWELSLILSFLYRSVYGYPKCSLDVTSEGERFEIEIFDTPPDMAGIKLQKCKQILSCMHRMPDLTEHRLFTVFLDGVYRVIPVSQEECFRQSVLSTLRVASGLVTAAYAVGLCDGAVISECGRKITPQMLIAAACVHPDFDSGSVQLIAQGVSFTVVDCLDCITLLTPVALVKRTAD